MPTCSQISQLIQSVLGDNEKLLWSGQPGQGLIFRSADIFLIPFSILWCGFAIFWEYTVAINQTSTFFLIYGGFFVLIGLYFVFGRFILDSEQRKKTYYGITNERVVIISGLFHRKIKSLNLHTLSDMTLSQKSDGSGTIFLGPISFWESIYGGMAWWPGMQVSPKFEAIQNAKRVYDILIEAQKSA